ncbi:hypothetical protein DSM14862_00518 [Sulfitobacter indolifex]|uniref:RNase NYN domain-containing protein n=1 Tax=Sulfitobacter indolifex HEL-45 TaxID=391624 RepID=A0ABP2DHC6_9RHOB|nr:hypothetical protein [Sulfitobacter indolifex]EDQ06775.1 hypothetical protein OIHEL45_08155 [Sulfitobacter indolifex HEL-45]UOA17761.1 hypothetical protein DSM14862_00518 [Sulfitobacter indolifex]
MFTPFLLLLGSLILTIAGASLPGWQDFMLLGVPCVIASAILLLRALAQPKRPGNKWIIVDGSNVMHWKSGEPNIRVVRDVVDELRARGYTPGVVFDANAGYLLIGRYQHDKALSSQLDLPVDRVLVVPKGTPADPYILQSARDYGGQVVSRDQFRDWAEAHPEIAEPGHLIKGGYRNGKLWLDLETEAVA